MPRPAMTRWAALLLLVGCGTLISRGPGNLPRDRDLGEVLHEGRITRTVDLYSAAGADDPALFVRYGSGFDEELQRDDLRLEVWIDQLSQPLDGPAILEETELRAVPAVGDVQAAVLFNTDTLHALVDDTWTTFPPLPQDPGQLTEVYDDIVVLAPGVAVISNPDWMFVSVDGWTQLDVPAGARPVSWADGELVVAWPEGDDLCEARWSASSGSAALTDEVCITLPTPASEVFAGINGTPSDHQVVVRDALEARGAKVRVYHLVNNTPATGPSFYGTGVLHSPGESTLTVVEHDIYDTATPVPRFFTFEQGELVDLQDHFFLDRPCGCTRETNPSCTCFTRDLISAAVTPLPGEQLRIVSVDAVDSITRFHLLEQPFSADDPLHDDAECPMACENPATQRCDEGAYGVPACESGEIADDPVDGEVVNQISINLDPWPVDGGTPAELPLRLDPADAEVETVFAVLPRPVFIVEPYTEVEVDIDVDGFETFTVAFSSGPPGLSQLLGPFPPPESLP